MSHALNQMDSDIRVERVDGVIGINVSLPHTGLGNEALPPLLEAIAAGAAGIAPAPSAVAGSSAASGHGQAGASARDVIPVNLSLEMNFISDDGLATILDTFLDWTASGGRGSSAGGRDRDGRAPAPARQRAGAGTNSNNLSRLHLRRLRFHMNRISDAGCGILASYLLRCRPELLPAEIHLSHNRITADGAIVLLQAVTQTYPRPGYKSHATPIWLRLEHNQIDPDAIKRAAVVMGLRWCTCAQHNQQLVEHVRNNGGQRGGRGRGRGGAPSADAAPSHAATSNSSGNHLSPTMTRAANLLSQGQKCSPGFCVVNAALEDFSFRGPHSSGNGSGRGGGRGRSTAGGGRQGATDKAQHHKAIHAHLPFFLDQRPSVTNAVGISTLLSRGHDVGQAPTSSIQNRSLLQPEQGAASHAAASAPTPMQGAASGNVHAQLRQQLVPALPPSPPTAPPSPSLGSATAIERLDLAGSGAGGGAAGVGTVDIEIDAFLAHSTAAMSLDDFYGIAAGTNANDGPDAESKSGVSDANEGGGGDGDTGDVVEACAAEGVSAADDAAAADDGVVDVTQHVFVPFNTLAASPPPPPAPGRPPLAALPPSASAPLLPPSRGIPAPAPGRSEGLVTGGSSEASTPISSTASSAHSNALSTLYIVLDTSAVIRMMEEHGTNAFGFQGLGLLRDQQHAQRQQPGGGDGTALASALVQQRHPRSVVFVLLETVLQQLDDNKKPIAGPASSSSFARPASSHAGNIRTTINAFMRLYPVLESSGALIRLLSEDAEDRVRCGGYHVATSPGVRLPDGRFDSDGLIIDSSLVLLRGLIDGAAAAATAAAAAAANQATASPLAPASTSAPAPSALLLTSDVRMRNRAREAGMPSSLWEDLEGRWQRLASQEAQVVDAGGAAADGGATSTSVVGNPPLTPESVLAALPSDSREQLLATLPVTDAAPRQPTTSNAVDGGSSSSTSPSQPMSPGQAQPISFGSPARSPSTPVPAAAASGGGAGPGRVPHLELKSAAQTVQQLVALLSEYASSHKGHSSAPAPAQPTADPAPASPSCSCELCIRAASAIHAASHLPDVWMGMHAAKMRTSNLHAALYTQTQSPDHNKQQRAQRILSSSADVARTGVASIAIASAAVHTSSSKGIAPAVASHLRSVAGVASKQLPQVLHLAPTAGVVQTNEAINRAGRLNISRAVVSAAAPASISSPSVRAPQVPGVPSGARASARTRVAKPSSAATHGLASDADGLVDGTDTGSDGESRYSSGEDLLGNGRKGQDSQYESDTTDDDDDSDDTDVDFGNHDGTGRGGGLIVPSSKQLKGFRVPHRRTITSRRSGGAVFEPAPADHDEADGDDDHDDDESGDGSDDDASEADDGSEDSSSSSSSNDASDDDEDTGEEEDDEMEAILRIAMGHAAPAGRARSALGTATASRSKAAASGFTRGNHPPDHHHHHPVSPVKRGMASTRGALRRAAGAGIDFAGFGVQDGSGARAGLHSLGSSPKTKRSSANADTGEYSSPGRGHGGRGGGFGSGRGGRAHRGGSSGSGRGGAGAHAPGGRRR